MTTVSSSMFDSVADVFIFTLIPAASVGVLFYTLERPEWLNICIAALR